MGPFLRLLDFQLFDCCIYLYFLKISYVKQDSKIFSSFLRLKKISILICHEIVPRHLFTILFGQADGGNRITSPPFCFCKLVNQLGNGFLSFWTKKAQLWHEANKRIELFAALNSSPVGPCKTGCGRGA